MVEPRTRKAGVIGVVTGMRSEQRLFARTGWPLVVCHGPGVARAERAASEALARGARALLSAGVAGALVAELPGAAALIATSVVTDDAVWPCDPTWHATVGTFLPHAARGTLLTVADALCTAPAKRDAASRSGALAVDMESTSVAAAAARAGVPFLALRVVLDRLDDALPTSALAGLDAQGRRRILPVLRGLSCRPQDLPALLSLARRERQALAQLRRIASALPSMIDPPDGEPLAGCPHTTNADDPVTGVTAC